MSDRAKLGVEPDNDNGMKRTRANSVSKPEISSGSGKMAPALVLALARAECAEQRGKSDSSKDSVSAIIEITG